MCRALLSPLDSNGMEHTCYEKSHAAADGTIPSAGVGDWQPVCSLCLVKHL